MQPTVRAILGGLALIVIAGCSAGASASRPAGATLGPTDAPTLAPHPTEPPWGHTAPGATAFAGRIAFSHYDEQSAITSIYVVAGTDGTVRRLTQDLIFPNVGSWSPDGRSLALDRTVCLDAVSRCASIISIIDVATGSIRDITQPLSGVLDFHASFSPDGHRLLFSSTRSVNDAEGVNLFTVGIDGSSPVGIPIDATTADLAGWSPDGTWIRYSEWSGFESPRLFEIHPDGSGRRAIDALAAVAIGHAVWSPDGSAVAYTADSALQPVSATESVTTPEIWASAPLGAPGRALVPWPWHGAAPAWSPDGAAIAFVGGPAGVDALCIVGLDGAEPKLVATPGLVPSDTPIAWTATTGD